ncbi:MAG: hypothetical protein Greene101447_123 [Parcubacteria group bacterium Greene1014_47]|nr:MAG: hypothetical protein Greene101447_123 [Parcubacteria group bacterium Greene1014_47]
MNKKLQIAMGVLVLGGLGALIWYSGTRTTVPQDEIISRTGIHWHPELKTVVKGEETKIPANIGIGMQYAGYPRYDPMMRMTDIHTHDDSGTLHWEVMSGPVKKEDVRLGSFFAIWGKKFDGSCILEHCNGSEGAVKMFVNGEPNTEFQNYLVKDGDQIEIRYE